MADGFAVIDLFCEDQGHELFFRALLARLAPEAGVRPQVRPISCKGGHGRAVTELKAWQRSRLQERGDLLVVLIDANSVGWSDRRKECVDAIQAGLYPSTVIGCPDPEVEAWCFADPGGLHRAFGVTWAGAARRTSVDHKLELRRTLERGGIPLLGDPMEIAWDLVPEVDLYAAGKRAPDLGHFVDELRSALQLLGAAR